MNEPPYAVVDIDGVLADVNHRLGRLASRPKDWDGFFAALPQDTPYAEGMAIAQRLAEDHTLVYLSGRPERTREPTQTWLTKHGFPPGDVLLRSDDDRRPAPAFKVTAVRRLARQHPVRIVVDDHPGVCQALRDAGFDVFETAWGHESDSPQGPLHEAQDRGHS